MVIGIQLHQIYESQTTLFYLIYVPTSFVYCYHVVKVNRLGLAQSDLIYWNKH